MYKKKIFTAVLLTGLASQGLAALPEISGKLTHESANFTKDGKTIGLDPRTGMDVRDDDYMKSETSLRVFLDGSVAESPYHVELQAYHNGEDDTNRNDWTSGESYTQRDPLREAYIDVSNENFDMRFGKQQVVWGTADGMKLLDSINPTDYSEMAQNQMEDSRIPVWMMNINASEETTGGNWQFIVAEGKSNVMAGLGEESKTELGSTGLTGTGKTTTEHNNGSEGHPFILKGVDTITGKRNGILNVAPALGAVAQSFDRGAYHPTYGYVSLRGYTRATVDDFASNYQSGDNQSIGFKGFCDGTNTGAQCLSDISNQSYAPNGSSLGGANGGDQNLINRTITNAQWTSSKNNGTSMFDLMPDATFATFDAFVNMKSKYLVDHDNSPITALRYSNSTLGGTNYSFNFTRGPDANPYVDMKWTDTSGNLLTETAVADTANYDVNGKTYVTNQLRAAGGSSNAVGGYVANAASMTHSFSTKNAVLVMTEKTDTISQVGGSFDTTFDTDFLGPLVIRGEGVFQKDVRSPVLTRRAANGQDLSHGFLVSSMKMEQGDRFKYVLGADITALTNMMVSLQFIQDRNLDYVDQGHKDAQVWKYTADMASMHLTNNLLKAEKNKDFYSLYLSKPFGESGQHRWNNIFIYEENGGKWNRLDVEYTIDDNTIATAEYNKYFGNENTQFGQLKNSSNIQVGVKYTF